MNLEETRAALKVLVAVAQADGGVDPAETVAVQQAVADWAPELAGEDVVGMFASTIDLDAELAKIKTPATRSRRSARGRFHRAGQRRFR